MLGAWEMMADDRPTMALLWRMVWLPASSTSMPYPVRISCLVCKSRFLTAAASVAILDKRSRSCCNMLLRQQTTTMMVLVHANYGRECPSQHTFLFRTPQIIFILIRDHSPIPSHGALQRTSLLQRRRYLIRVTSVCSFFLFHF
jgi:hypothetical protein